MSYNPNFYNNFHGSNFTFHIPPPPLPPPFLITSQPGISDQDFVKQFELKISPQVYKENRSLPSISEVKEKLHKLLNFLNELKKKEKELSNNITMLDDVHWNKNMTKVKEIKSYIDSILTEVKSSQLDLLRKLIAKRTAKRLRLKRVNERKKREKEYRIKELQERSRKIDENLQKIKDDINKAKKEEEAKIQADIILKEVLRKKHDAKKCIVKLDAFMKLRKARQNTAKGRGEDESESDAIAFNNNIEKLKSLWTQKLAQYDKEEVELRKQLKEESDIYQQPKNEMEKQVSDYLEKWRDFLFGGENPQVDFYGDIGRFVAIRSQWDRYIDPEGTPLPVGWVTPSVNA
ncbi:hypothetical protein K1T71_009481 [Dendrolimus kikuchii]|uniref:Uncharacterized protein n=1 Tax=Dendrolimus kikuchii TaxID=765133 RepID=A0ACC1CV67_9NEOP|nr:hypothetical protein K1T71_009481 [Dendrolimus kikuchii]